MGAFFRPSVESLAVYQPGKPVEDVQRELGLERVVKLASNEGPFGPFDAAREALARATPELNRYPDGGAYRLHGALAERHGVEPGWIAVGSGADGCIDMLSQATLDPGDEVVCGWPSFPSYVIYGTKLGAVVHRVGLADHRYDLGALLDAVTERTKLVYICHPNNPTGTTSTREELDDYFERVPAHVLTVVDQAIYGLAGLRVGYAVAEPDVCAAMVKVRRPFDVTTSAQVAALASLDDEPELARRREVNTEGLARLESILRDAGMSPVPSAGNFLYADTGADATALYERLLHEGVIVRPLAGFGAPTAIRVSVGTPEELDFFAAALGRVLQPA
jgi:histidinol-phosphate aminotransferase